MRNGILKNHKGISLTLRLVLVAVMVITTFGFIAQQTFAYSWSTVTQVVSPSPTSFLLNIGGFTELIWWKVTGIPGTPSLIRHVIRDPSNNIIDFDDFPVSGASLAFPPEIYNPEDTFAGTIATVSSNQDFTSTDIPANFPLTGNHLLINWVDVGAYTLVGNAFTLAVDPLFLPAVGASIIDQGEHQGDPAYAHKWDVPVGAVPGDYVSCVYFFTVEVLDGRQPKPPPDPGHTWEGESYQTFWVRQPPPPPQVTKTAELAVDADDDGVPSPGDTLKYTAEIVNTGNAAANEATFSDTPDANTTLVAGSVTKTQGSVIKGNHTGDKTVEISIGNIPAGGTATVTFEVTINSPIWEFFIANQATVSGSNFSTVKSDDPGTQKICDATVTKVKMSPPVHGPGLSQWGIAVLVVLFGGAMVWMMRRRQIRRLVH